MTFFNSELVKEEINKIEELQSKAFHQFCNFDSLTQEEKRNHIKILQDLLNKQKLFYTRLSLSNDLEAVEKKNEFNSLFNNVNIMQVFENLEQLISEMKESI